MRAPRIPSEAPAIARLLELALHVTAGEEARISLFRHQHTFSRLRSGQSDPRPRQMMEAAAPIALPGDEAGGEFVVRSGSREDLHGTVIQLAALASDILAFLLQGNGTPGAKPHLDDQLIDHTWHVQMKQALAPRDYLEMTRRWTELTVTYGAEIRYAESTGALQDAAACMHDAASAFGATKLAEASLRIQQDAAFGSACRAGADRLRDILVATHREIERMHTGALWDVDWRT